MSDSTRSDVIRAYFPTVYSFNPTWRADGKTLIQDQSGRVLSRAESDELILAITRGYAETPTDELDRHNAGIRS